MIIHYQWRIINALAPEFKAVWCAGHQNLNEGCKRKAIKSHHLYPMFSILSITLHNKYTGTRYQRVKNPQSQTSLKLIYQNNVTWMHTHGHCREVTWILLLMPRKGISSMQTDTHKSVLYSMFILYNEFLHFKQFFIFYKCIPKTTQVFFKSTCTTVNPLPKDDISYVLDIRKTWCNNSHGHARSKHGVYASRRKGNCAHAHCTIKGHYSCLANIIYV